MSMRAEHTIAMHAMYNTSSAPSLSVTTQATECLHVSIHCAAHMLCSPASRLPTTSLSRLQDRGGTLPKEMPSAQQRLKAVLTEDRQDAPPPGSQIREGHQVYMEFWPTAAALQLAGPTRRCTPNYLVPWCCVLSFFCMCVPELFRLLMFSSI